MKLRGGLTLVLCASLIPSIYLAVQWRQAEHRAAETTRWTRFVMDSLGTTLNLPSPPVEPFGRDSLYWQWVATTARMQSRRWQQAVQHWARLRGTVLDPLDIELLKQQGLVDPPRQLRENLVAHAELIPYPGVMGGTMFFDEIVLLAPSFAFASFEDGHTSGAMLLEFEVTDSTRIAWKRLWARLD